MKKQEFIDYIKENCIKQENRSYVDKPIEYHIPYCSFGDYDNSTSIERANIQFLKELENPLVQFGCGVFGYTYAYFDLEVIKSLRWHKKLATQAGEITDIITGLYNYPAISDEKVSEYEMTAEIEHWESYGKENFIEAIEIHFSLTLPDEYNSEKLYELYRALAEKSNTYPIFAQSNIYINWENLISYADIEDLNGIFYQEFNPENFKCEPIENLRSGIELLEKFPMECFSIDNILEEMNTILHEKEKQLLENFNKVGKK